MALRPSIFGFGGGPNLLTRDLATFGIIAPEWGIFAQSGKSVVTFDNVINVEYKQEYTVSDYPLEKGAFESYDKVQMPFDVRIRFSSGGSFNNRQALIKSLQAIVGNLKLYDVVTPEATYTSVNIVHQDYSRNAQNGVGLIMIDVWLVEVRVNADTELSNTAKPDGAKTVNGGQVQPQQPTPEQATLVSNAIAAAGGTSAPTGISPNA